MWPTGLLCVRYAVRAVLKSGQRPNNPRRGGIIFFFRPHAVKRSGGGPPEGGWTGRAANRFKPGGRRSGAGGFVRRVAHTPRHDGVRRCEKEPAVIRTSIGHFI